MVCWLLEQVLVDDFDCCPVLIVLCGVVVWFGTLDLRGVIGELCDSDSSWGLRTVWVLWVVHWFL